MRSIMTAALAAAAAACVCSGAALFPADIVIEEDKEPSRTEVSGEVPYFEEDACPFDFNPATYTINCGYLIVPEQHANPNGSTIELAVAILRSRAADPHPDPIVYLAGGPGGSALYEVDLWLPSPFLDERDIVLIDQRGTGFSFPSLDCPEEDDSDNGAEQCKNRLERDGVNLSAYNSAESAADLEALRTVLGIEQWNVIGVSYGSRLALTLMRDFPAGLRSVIIDGPYPPEVDAYTEQGINTLLAFETLFAGCAASPECAEAYPDLRGTFYGLVEQLEEDPLVFDAYDYDFDETIEVELYGYDFMSLIFENMYDSFHIPYLPFVIEQAARGETDLLGDLYLGYALTEETGQVYAEGITFPPDDVSDAEGMFYSVECAEEYPFADAEASFDLMAEYPPVPVDLLQWDAESFGETCAVWGVRETGAIEDQPVVSDIPTLVMVGQYDPITPPSWGEVAARSLSSGSLLVFPGLGHAVIDGGPCPQQIGLQFLANPTASLDTECMSSMGPPDWVIP